MTKVKNILSITIVTLVMISCSSQKIAKAEKYKDIYKTKPNTILIMPPINKSTHVEAKEYFYNTLNHELCEDGYYVIPPFMAMDVLKKESAYDSEMFIGRNDLSIFGELFGVDMIFFTTIHNWKKSHIGGKVNIDVEYEIRAAKTNTVLYKTRGNVRVDTSVSVNGGGIAGALISLAATAVNTASTKYVDVARLTNLYTLESLPKGKYHHNYLLDKNEKVLKKNKVSATVPRNFKRKEKVYTKI